jgi:hypothetical protein
MVFEQTAIESEARHIGRVLKAIELFFLDGELNAVFVNERDGRAVAEGRDAEKVEVLFDEGILPWRL